MRALRLDLLASLRHATSTTGTMKRGYVLEGALRVQVGEDEIEAGTGSSVFVPRGTPHTYWNAGPGRVRYLLVMTSNIYRLIREIHLMAERSPAALRAVFTK
jgi:uncharacterized cupin superfamily protein